MKIKLKKGYEAKFNPHAVTVVMGQVTKVTLKDFLENPQNWINSPLGMYYENPEELREYLARRKKEKPAKVLDMRQARRGSAFDPNKKSKIEEAKGQFLEKQEKRISKRKKVYLANLEKLAAERAEMEAAAAKAAEDLAKAKKDAAAAKKKLKEAEK